MALPIITDDIVFQKISSPLGNVGSPFDKALANRDMIVTDFIKKISRKAREVAPGQSVILADSWGNEVQGYIKNNINALFPGMGGFASGGGPLS